jgi:hypothetical protein
MRNRKGEAAQVLVATAWRQRIRDLLKTEIILIGIAKR